MLGVAFIVQFSNALATQGLAPLAPLFQPELGLSKSEVGLFSSIIYAGSWGVLIVAGSLCDRFGLRRLLSLIHISEPTRLGMISYAVFCLKKKNNNKTFL